MASTRATAVLLGALVAVATATQDPSACADHVVQSVDNIVDAANDAAQAAVDCTWPTLDESSCANDLVNLIKEMANLAGNICTLTLVCGDIDNTCGMNSAAIVSSVADLSGNLIAAAGDCISDPFLCTYDVMSSVEVFNGLVGGILGALESCNHSPISRRLAPVERVREASRPIREVALTARQLLGPGQQPFLLGLAGAELKPQLLALQEQVSALQQEQQPSSAGLFV